jgi:hypothetical protein
LLFVDFKPDIIGPFNYESDLVYRFKLIYHDLLGLVTYRFQTLHDGDHEHSVLFMSFQLLVTVLNLEAEVWKCKYWLEFVPEHLVQELKVKCPLARYREFSKNPII